MIYCPYTDREIPESETNTEHIIPLSLGGVNGFEIPVDAAFNSKVGSELDGALANEFFWALRRTEYDARGHSGKEPYAVIRRATYGEDERVAQAYFHKTRGLSVWDARDREFKKVSGRIRISTSLSVHLPVRFTAKVALAAGYYVYGDLFREQVDHRQLRDVMCIDPAKLDRKKDPAELGLDHLTLRVDKYLAEAPDDPNSLLVWLRAFCSSVKGSVVVLMPTRASLEVGVGILGQFLGFVNVPANTTRFPKHGDYEIGHVLAVIGKKLERCSFMDGAMRWMVPECMTEDSEIPRMIGLN